MGRFIDLTGKKFGKWTVIEKEYFGLKNKWKCLCECGYCTTVLGDSLRGNKSTKCKKCSTSDRKFSEIDHLKHYLFSTYKIEAKKRKIKFSLSLDDFYNLITSNCYYCNSLPRNQRKKQAIYVYIQVSIEWIILKVMKK
jgi:hypothetical protein